MLVCNLVVFFLAIIKNERKLLEEMNTSAKLSFYLFLALHFSEFSKELKWAFHQKSNEEKKKLYKTNSIPSGISDKTYCTLKTS